MPFGAWMDYWFREFCAPKRLSENCWQGRYSPVEDGKRKTYNVYAPTEDECKDKLIRLIEDQKK